MPVRVLRQTLGLVVGHFVSLCGTKTENLFLRRPVNKPIKSEFKDVFDFGDIIRNIAWGPRCNTNLSENGSLHPLSSKNTDVRAMGDEIFYESGMYGKNMT